MDKNLSEEKQKIYQQKWIGKINPLPQPKTSHGTLKQLFPEMDSPSFQRAVGMIKAKLLALDINEKRGVLSYKGHLYPCVFVHKNFMQQFGDKLGKEVWITVWPTLYARIEQPDGKKKKTLILRVKGLRPEVQEDGYFEVRGIIHKIEPRENKVKVLVSKQNKKSNYIVRLFGSYSGKVGDFVAFECHLDKGDLYIDAWKLIEPAKERAHLYNKNSSFISNLKKK